MKCELYQFYPEVYPFNLWIYVGKEVKNSEPFSYLNGWIGRKCEEVKIGIAEDKLIWESK